MRQRRHVLIMLAALALLALFAGCKAESPTAPPVVGGGTGSTGGNPGGGVSPPVGANVVLTASTLTPKVDDLVTLTATVTSGGAVVPNGTAVEFVASAGQFT